MLGVFDLSSCTPLEQDITARALRRCTFDFERLRPGLQAAVGRDHIPVEWADLSRFSQLHVLVYVNEGAETGERPVDLGHFDVEEDGDHGHGILWRGRALGLAWYSGRVSIEKTLADEPELAGEVFLSEAAHMVDFFLMTPEQRARVFALFHGDDPTPHDHGWFEETGNHDYWSWVGESFMGGFVRAFSDFAVTLTGFNHAVTDQVARGIRDVLSPAPTVPVFGTKGSAVYHDEHRGVRQIMWWPAPAAAIAEGRRPCGVCKPRAA